MSVLVTSNIHKHQAGLPYGKQPLFEVSPVLNVLEIVGLPHQFFDGQDKTEEEYISYLKASPSKIIVIQLNEPFIQVLQKLKKELEEKTIVVCTPDESLIQVLVFDYGIDYVCFDLNGLPDLIQTANNAFAPFYDHVKGIAYKNGLGELSKNEKSGLDDVSSENHPSVLDGYSNSVSDLQNVLTDFTQYKTSKEYDAFHLKVPSSKKAVRTLSKIIEEKEIVNNLSVYPSCDIEEDKKFFTDMALLIELSVAKKSAGFFKRFGLNRKLGKLFK